MGYFSDSLRAKDVVLADPRDSGNVTVDFRMLTASERDAKTWVNRSDEPEFRNKILWIAGDPSDLENQAREFARSLAMVRRYKPRRESLTRDRQRLLLEEEARAEELERRLQEVVDTTWMSGHFYFRGRQVDAREFGGSLPVALTAAANRLLPDLYPSFLATQLSPTELMQLLAQSLSGPSPKFVDDLGLLSLDAGKYVPSCEGVAPQRVIEFIDHQQGVGGMTLLAEFGGPPYGYTANVIKACVAGLLRAGKLRVEPDGGQMLTAVRDAGVRDVFDKDRGFKRASFFPAGEGAISARDKNLICRFFEQRLDQKLDRENEAIADAVMEHFAPQAQRLREVYSRLRQLPVEPGTEHPIPKALLGLEKALEACVRVVRQTEPTVQAVKRHLDSLNDGFEQLAIYDADLTGEAITNLRAAADVSRYQLAQLEDLGDANGDLDAAAQAIRAQLGGDKPWRDLTAINPHLGDGPRGLRRAASTDPREPRRPRRGHSRTGEGAQRILDTDRGSESPRSSTDRRGAADDHRRCDLTIAARAAGWRQPCVATSGRRGERSTRPDPQRGQAARGPQDPAWASQPRDRQRGRARRRAE